MAVKPGQYGQEYEKAIAAGKSASEAHDIAVKGSTVGKEKKKKGWVQNLKEKVGVTLKPEKERRMNLEAKKQAGEGRLKAAGKKTTKELETKYKTVKVPKKKKKDTVMEGENLGTKSKINELRKGGLTDSEIKSLMGKK